MKKLLFSFLAVTFSCFVSGQGITKADVELLEQKEDSLKEYAVKLIQGRTAEDRFNADSIFTRTFVRALVTKNSFRYPFDSLETIAKLYPPDSSFRIFTWQMVINENIVRQHGAIQMRTNDGSLKLFPLIDKSDVTINIADTFANNRGWMGAVYYQIIETKNGDRSYYTLFGYDENNIRSSRKIIEVLNFVEGEPVFGGRVFSFEEDSAKRPVISRYIMEYKKNAGARLTYDQDLGMVVFEHLESETNEPAKKWTFIPDGDYEGFKWKNGKWVHVNKIFTQVTPEGKPPVPHPLINTDGDLNVDKLPDNNNTPTRNEEDTSAGAKKKKPATPKKKVVN